MGLIQHLKQYLAESPYNLFGPLTESELAAQAEHDRNVEEMAQRLQDETEMRMGMQP